MSTPASDSTWITIARVFVVVGLLAVSVVLVFPPVADYAGELLNGSSASQTTPEDKKAPSPPEKGANAESKRPKNPAPSLQPPWSDPAETPQLSPSFAEHRPQASRSTDSDATKVFDSSVMPASAVQEGPSERTSLQPYQSELKRLGATYIVVERLKESNVFECRCLASLNPKYSKAFSAEASSAREAASQVVEQVKEWRRAKSRVVSSESKPNSARSPKGSTKSKEGRSTKKVEQ